jgi:putative transposase
MAQRKPAAEPLPTIWKVPDDLWTDFLEPILRQHDSEPRTGRPRIDQRQALDGIIYIMRSGCQWNALPKEFGDDSSVHRTYQRWVKLGIFRKIWAKLTSACDEIGGVGFDWQSSDTSMGKARFGGIKSAQIPRIGRRMAASAAC